MPLELESKALARCFNHADAFWHHFLANAVAGDHRNFEPFHDLIMSRYVTQWALLLAAGHPPPQPSREGTTSVHPEERRTVPLTNQ